ncbi:MAG: GNAT family N-acetyltransferase [Alphaproteobacteria bacterium]|nr:GNAT family N-acetyltransferase [Alphaproteobacteria bacterium]
MKKRRGLAMAVKLVKPDRKYLPSVYEAVAEYRATPSKFGIHIVQKMIAATENDFADYFQNIADEEAGIGLKPGYVTHTVYWLVDDNQYVGSFALRHALTPSLGNIGGHIAYEIRPSRRRQGYASKGLRLCLDEAHKRGIEQALVTCNAENIASYGVMHKAMTAYGGFEDSEYKKDELVEKRVWIKTNR